MTAPTTSTDTSRAAPARFPAPLPAWPRRILVATHGEPSAAAAIHASRALSVRHGATVFTLTVYVPDVVPPTVPGRRGLEQCEGAERGKAAAQLEVVRAQCSESGEGRIEAAQLEVGDPAALIVRIAAEAMVSLVIIGIGQGDPSDRKFGNRTPLGVVRHLSVPLYAVAVGCADPEASIVVFPDGRPHLATVRAAIHCIRPKGRITIVLPSARPGLSIEPDCTALAVAEQIASQLADERHDIAIEGVTVDEEILAGVLRVASDVGAQLIAVPVYGSPGAVRSFLPNLADSLLLAATCSVLAVPAGIVALGDTPLT